jgi:hypothetical protein
MLQTVISGRLIRSLLFSFIQPKNKSSVTAKAFKAIGNAVAILTDPGKRKQYHL